MKACISYIVVVIKHNNVIRLLFSVKVLIKEIALIDVNVLRRKDKTKKIHNFPKLNMKLQSKSFVPLTLIGYSYYLL